MSANVRFADDEADEDDLDLSVVAAARCPHCGALATFPGMSAVFAFVCRECGEGVEIPVLVV